MRISLIQPDLSWENKIRNFAVLDEMIAPLYNKTDLVILPEMFTTGFLVNPEPLAEPPEAETFEWMKNISGNGNFALCGSYIVTDKGKYFNRMFFVTPANEYWYYDKRHLFTFAGENRYFTAGEKRIIFSFMDFRISLFVCYDLRFPVWSRSRNDCDLMIYSANWPRSRRDAWNILLKARAIENQCYVAGVNRVGVDGEGVEYCGDSVIVDPSGSVMESGGFDEITSVTAGIDLNMLSDFRKKFPFSGDADSFVIDP
jgi:omega-amidase